MNGYALVLTVGDRPQAASIAASAIADGLAENPEFARRPRRAATWLHARVFHDAGRIRDDHSVSVVERMAALASMGVAEPAAEALAVLDLRERAAIIAASVERMPIREVATIIGRTTAEAQLAVRAARKRYMEAVLVSLSDIPASPPGEGGVAARVERVARASARAKRNRRRAKPKTDLDLRFVEWLLSGSEKDPPPELAVHAASCIECIDRIAAIDLLSAIDVTRAGAPPTNAPAVELRMTPLAWAAAVAGGLIFIGVVNLAGWQLAGAVGLRPADPTATPFQDVLGSTGAPSPSPLGSPSLTTPGAAVPGETLSPGESPVAVNTSFPPSPGQSADSLPTIPPIGPPLPTSSPFASPPPTGPAPSPTAFATPSPAPPTPEPTRRETPSPAPTVPPTPEPTPAPTAEPTPPPDPSNCTDGIDNDGDGFTDLLDLGCVLAGNEFAF